MSDMLLLILAVNLAVNASVCFATNMSTGMSQYVSIYVSWHVSECFFGASRRESFFAFIFQMFAVNEIAIICHHLPSAAWRQEDQADRITVCPFGYARQHCRRHQQEGRRSTETPLLIPGGDHVTSFEDRIFKETLGTIGKAFGNILCNTARAFFLVLFFGYTLKWYPLLIIYISSSRSFTMC